MVRPKSRKSGSGQSSILKAALRQPLQHVSSNVSLNQESPVTSKLKRRVSFAEKNHVKEFADSVEQGTLWNNSYEESSNQNTGQIDLNNQNHETRTNNNHSTNSDMIVSENGNLMNDSLELTECLVTMGSLKSIYTEETPLNKSISLAHQSKSNNEGNNILIESNYNINICGHKSINVHNNISSLNNMEGSDLNKTCIQDISMEVTEIPSFMKSQNILPVKCKQVLEEKENIPISNIIIKSNVPSNSTNEMKTISNKTQYFCTETLEFTECLQSTKEPLDLQQQFSRASALMNDENMINHQTQIFQNAPMEMTCAIPLTRRRNSTDQTVIFHDASMDDTMMVTSVMNKKQKLMNKSIPQIEDDNRFFKSMINSVNKTKLLDVSMDITEGIYSLPHSTKVNDVTDTVNILNYQSSAINGETELNDDSMEFTVAATNLPQVVHNIDREKLPQVTKMNACTMSNQIRLSSENTKIFQNESMAITEPLHVLSSLNILQNDSQELKDVIMNFPRNNQNIMSPNTKIFQNMSMEITNAIANLPILPNLEKSSENIENNLNTNEKQIDVIEHGSSQENSMDFTTPVYSNPSSFTITSNKIVDTTIKNNTFKYTNENNDIIENNSTKHVNENRDHSLLQNKSNNPVNEISNKNEKLEKHDCILDSMYEKTRKNHSMSETVQETNVQFNNSNSNINKSADQAVDDTYISSTTYCNDDFENTENISTDNQPVKALTSLISSFVYADMIEDDSFVKTIHEVQQEIQSRENDMDMNSVVDIVNAQAINTQSFEKCIIENKQIVQQSENYFKCYHEDNNIQVDDIMINKEVNNQHNSDIVSNKINEIHENIFENSINNERLIDTSTEVEVIGSDKQLHKAKKNVENNSATYIIKSKKNSDIDINEHINDHSSNDQVLCTSHVLSPTLIFAYNQNKTYIDENNIIPTADVADLTCSMNVTENYDNNSSKEEVNHMLEENIGKNNNFQEDKFSLIVKKLKIHMHSNDCIWDLYFENIDKQMIVVGFISTSLLIIIYTQNDIDTNTCMIKDINVISRLEDDENILLSIAHKLIREKINIEHISQLYKYEEDIIPLLNHISEDVKLILDFIFDLKQLEDSNLMEIDTECITFISRSKCMDIILKITMKVKLFDKINSSNIKVVCILGTVIEKDIRELFTNVKKDHKFLRRYMSDIKDYIDIMEQINDANKKCRY